MGRWIKEESFTLILPITYIIRCYMYVLWVYGLANL